MLTSRGWWFLLVGLAVTAIAASGLSPGHATLGTIGLTLLLWLFGQWMLFAVRAGRIVPALRLERELWDERGPVKNLWAGRSFEVRLRLSLHGWLGLPHVRLQDRAPAGVEVTNGRVDWQGSVLPGRAIEWRYRVHCGGVGQARFEGVRVEIVDLQGFFYHTAFVSEPCCYRILPMLVDARGRGPTTKRHNLLPPPGVHRLRRPGSGSELLDLRDYLPGDPPRTIAWKISARRDRLITKEFESEVPVRCTLFLDTSHSVRLGPPGQNALARQVEIAAAIAQATVGARDLIGLCRFDEQTSDTIRPARTPQHLARLLNLLADTAGLAPTQGKLRPDKLVPLAYAFAQEVYPPLLRPEVNAFPSWLPWLFPRALGAIRDRTWGDYCYRLLPLWLILYVGLACGGLGLAAGGFFWFWLSQGRSLGNELAWILIILLVSGQLSIALYFLRLPARLFFTGQRRLYRWRKQLAAIFSVQHALMPGGLALLLEDDELFALHCQRFLAEHHIPYSLPFYDRRGRFLFAAPEKVEILAQALLRAVRLSHDNELYVLLADLLELPGALGPLLRAVKVALARHHQVMVICPWPPGIEPPPVHLHQTTVSSLRALDPVTTQRLHEAFFELRQSFARIGVPVLCARGEDPVPLIVDRLDRLRTARCGPGR